MKDLKEVLPHYLPYGMEVKWQDGKDYYIFELSDIKYKEGVVVSPEGDWFNFNDCKPILYSLAALTDELPGIGVAAEKIFTTYELEDKLVIQKDYMDFPEIWLISDDKAKEEILVLADYVYLIKHHFNIFGLSEDQFIDKRTINV